MKSKILLAIFGLFSYPLYSQWENISIETSTGFWSVSFIDEHSGLVSGGRELYKTTNGGDDWEMVYYGDTNVFLDEVLAVNTDLVLAFGLDFKNAQSVIIRSTNGGQTWEDVDNDLNAFLSSAFFIDDTTGFVVGGGTIAKTKDGGLTWTRASVPVIPNMRYESVFFTTSLKGFAVGGWPNDAIILQTQDGGLTWEEIEINTDSYLQSIFFTDSLRGYTVGWYGEILSTQDGGMTWVPQLSVNMGGNLEILFTNDSTGYIVGGIMNELSIQKTTNRGALWLDISPDFNQRLSALDFPTEDIGYVAGELGTILKTTSGGITAVPNMNVVKEIVLFPNPTKDIVTLYSNGIIDNIRIVDNTAKSLEFIAVSSNRYTLNVEHYPSGLYFIIIDAGESYGVHPFFKI